MSVLTRPARRERPGPEVAEESMPGEPSSTRRSALRLPHGLKSARFGIAVALILAAGLVSMLVVNTSLAGGAIELGGLEAALARTNEQHEALEAEVDGISSPGALQVAAAGLGMVPASAPAFLDPATGKVSGALEPAAAPVEPFVPAPQVAAPPTPAPQSTATPTDAPQPSGASPAPSPSPSPTPPADPGADGAVVISPGASPAPTPGPAPSGDSAIVVVPEVD